MKNSIISFALIIIMLSCTKKEKLNEDDNLVYTFHIEETNADIIHLLFVAADNNGNLDTIYKGGCPNYEDVHVNIPEGTERIFETIECPVNQYVEFYNIVVKNKDTILNRRAWTENGYLQLGFGF